MNERELRVATRDGEMRTFVVHPDREGPFPVAVLYMDGVGYRKQIKAHARCFAAAGYYCVAPDLFYRAGDGVRIDMAQVSAANFEGPEAKRMMALVRSLKPDMVLADTAAVLAEVVSDPTASSGAKVCVGYCMGARFALDVTAALRGEFVAVAGIHPGALITDEPDSPHHNLADLRAEVYFAFAGNDRSVTSQMVERFRGELARTGVRGAVETLPGTFHGFAMADLAVYQQEAAERSFERTIDLWRRNLAQDAVAA